MIAIFGNTHDDLLYLESVMTAKREGKAFDKYPLLFGNIFNQEVVLVEGVYSNYLSGILATHLIREYYVILVLSLGKVTALTEDYKFGDIAVSKMTFAGDVDFSSEAEVSLGQIPSCPLTFPSQKDILSYICEEIEKRTYATYYQSTFVSSNASYVEKKQLEAFSHQGAAFGIKEHAVLDNNIGGIAVASYLAAIPFVGVKVVSRFLDKPYTIEDYGETLRKYIELGKAVVSTLGDIGRSDLLEGGTFNG